ncbi:MAG: AAA family ATPase [Candidatus Bathyarchaeota archaeon]|nr:MAG: AAA family ATPase [Candidatus Bathyarchaeota archaeon]
MKIAVSGKGGVGKTLVAGAMAHSFVRRGFKTIAIDADPSPNLALTLGVPLEEMRLITPISENKPLIESKTRTTYSGVYRLSFAVDDVISDFSVETPYGVNLVVMGTVKSVGSGCTCPANAVIRALLRHLIVEKDEAVVVDMEAGIEHLGRGTAKHVDTMLVVANPTIKSLEIARKIYRLAETTGIKQTFLVGNKIASKVEEDAVQRFAKTNNMALIDLVPFDMTVGQAEIQGRTPLENPETKAIRAIEEISRKLIQRE